MADEQKDGPSTTESPRSYGFDDNPAPSISTSTNPVVSDDAHSTEETCPAAPLSEGPQPIPTPYLRQVNGDDAVLIDVPKDGAESGRTMDEATVCATTDIAPPRRDEASLEEGADEDEIDYNDADIQRDAANIVVTAIVHVALIFFAVLLVCAVGGCIIAGGKFGFVTFVALLFLVAIMIFSGYCVMKTIENDAKLRPVRRQVMRWQAIAKAVVVREIRNFQLDMNDHMLLMDGPAEYEDIDDDGVDEGLGDGMPTMNGQTRETRRRDKPRSLVFGLVVKPILKGTGRIKRLRRRKKKDASTETYVPPSTSEVV